MQASWEQFSLYNGAIDEKQPSRANKESIFRVDYDEQQALE